MSALLLAISFASTPPSAAPLRPTKQDVEQAISSHGYVDHARADFLSWRRDLQQALRRGSVEDAADAVAAKYGFDREVMRRLVAAWVIAQSREFEQDRKWV